MISGLAEVSGRVLRHLAGLTVLLLTFFPGKLPAQNYFFDNYGVAEGIAQSTVFDIHQDHNDYIWLATRGGTSRFDGIEFVNYTMEDGLAENGVRVIFRDKKNNIWLGHSGGGISIYDGHKFSVYSPAGNIFDSDITAILTDEEGNLWITSELSGAVKITEISDSLSSSKYELFIGKSLSDRVYGAYKAKDGTLYFITDAFLKVYQPEENTFTGFYIEGMPTFFLITCMFEDSRNNLWFGTHNGGLYHYTTDEDSFEFYDTDDGLASNWITDITEDKNGVIWAGTWGGGLSLVSDEGVKVMDNSNGLLDQKIRKIVEDREGNILIGTNENGIAIFKGYQFISYFTRDGLTDPQVWSVLQDKSGKFWFGTSKGISIYKPGAGGTEEFSEFHKLKNTRVTYLKEDIYSRIWIGTDNQGVFTFDRITGNFTYEHRLNSYISSLLVTSLETDEEGKVWVGSLDGLIVYDHNTKNTRYYTQTNGLAGNEITSLYKAPDGKMWIGSRGLGLNYFFGDSICHLQLEEDFTATSIIADSRGYLWVGTEARGVLKIDPLKAEIVDDLKESKGLLANLINLVAIDNNDRVYIGTNKGLNIYHTEEEKIFSYNHKNGFTGIETKPNAVYFGDKGKLWFGTVKGVTSFNPDLFKPSDLEPLTHIINFKVNLEDKELIPGRKLKHTDNDIIFEYISICLTNPEAVAYRIMLEGADNEWRPATTQTSVTYPSLSPNKYTFKVIARNSEGKWNEEPVIYSFQIMPPFYQTTWFILLSIFAGSLTIFIYIKIRERNLMIEKRILEEKVVERTAVVTAQKEQLASKNKDITDSIRYAKRIQVAMLPPVIPFDNTFVLFRPKDIVSGDFYWLEIIDNKEYIAAVDCTGHGVPGAFMSIIGSNFLNKIVKEQHVYEPANILNILNQEVIENLKSTDEDSTVYDGMDIALICYDREKEILEYAGGYNPLILVRSGELQEVKADRFSIGRSSLKQQVREFTNHRIEMRRGDIIYIYTDGYADQFGGEEGRKFKLKPMKELLIAINEKTMEEQKSILNSTIDAWRGDIDQVDDILIIGRKF